METFSKSLASLGGCMVAKKEVCDYVRHSSRPFIFSASIPPANVACARKALEIIKREPNRGKNVLKIADYVRKGLRARNIDIRDSVAPIIPINTYEDERTFIASKMLLKNGVYVNSCVSPSVPKGQAILRTSYTATHTEELIDEAMDIIAKTFKEDIPPLKE